MTEPQQSIPYLRMKIEDIHTRVLAITLELKNASEYLKELDIEQTIKQRSSERPLPLSNVPSGIIEDDNKMPYAVSKTKREPVVQTPEEDAPDGVTEEEVQPDEELDEDAINHEVKAMIPEQKADILQQFSRGEDTADIAERTGVKEKIINAVVQSYRKKTTPDADAIQTRPTYSPGMTREELKRVVLESDISLNEFASIVSERNAKKRKF